MRSEAMRSWRAADVTWGDTFCEAPGCFKAAELLAEYHAERELGVPLCLDDAETLLASWQLPASTEFVFWNEDKPAYRPRPMDPESWDATPEKWAAKNGYYGAPIDVDADPDWDIPF
jgi:hypothetical protein